MHYFHMITQQGGTLAHGQVCHIKHSSARYLHGKTLLTWAYISVRVMDSRT